MMLEFSKISITCAKILNDIPNHNMIIMMMMMMICCAELWIREVVRDWLIFNCDYYTKLLMIDEYKIE